MRLEELLRKQQSVISRYEERQRELQEKLKRVETDLQMKKNELISEHIYTCAEFWINKEKENKK